MRLTIRLFASCRERAGCDRIEIEVPGEAAGLSELKASIALQHPVLSPFLSSVRIALNREFADETARVRAGDEIALIPPVSGGSGQGPFSLALHPIDPALLERAVAFPGAGAVVSFLGTVRDSTAGHPVLALEYEAYAEMAEAFLRKIGLEVSDRWSGTRVAIVHRVGRLEVGQISVAISVASPHRAAAFEGCRHAIERLKQDVPIWKKEIRKDGSIWVGIGS